MHQSHIAPDHGVPQTLVPQDTIAAQLIARHQEEYAAISQHEAAKAQVREGLQRLPERLEAARNLLISLQDQLSGLVTVDFGKSIFEHCKANGRPARVVAADIAPLFLLKQSGGRILELAEADCKAAEAAWEDFRRKHRAIIAELDKETALARQEYQAAIASEQNQAFEQRAQAAQG